ncbi:MAG TPA: universal stress protein [Planctomycetota bacterium]|nr:universal stress protein [Planctomycetota bacterium]
MNPERLGWKAEAVCIPLERAEDGALALPVARSLARLAGAPVHFLHVAPEEVPLEEVRRRLGLTAEMLSGAMLEVAVGDPGEEILRAAEAREGTLIVAALRVRSEPGPVVLRLLGASSVPVVLVPAGRSWTGWALRRLLLPMDGAPASAAALCPVIELAAAARAAVEFLHVSGGRASGRREAGALTAPRYVDQPQHEWPQWASEFMERLHCLCRIPEGLTVRFHLATGEAGEAILRRAVEEGADLIGLSWRGTPAAGRAETFREVVRRAPCPLAVLRCARLGDR